MDKRNDSFIRWQGRSIEETGKLINLLLGLCLATLGFVVSKLPDKNFQFFSCYLKAVVITGALIILISTILLLVLIFNRLSSFRETAHIARKREKNDRDGIIELRQQVKRRDRRTWTLVQFSIFSFILGQAFIVIGLIIEIMNR